MTTWPELGEYVFSSQSASFIDSIIAFFLLTPVFVFEMFILIQTVRLLFTVYRACMESVTRCIWVCPACWTTEACPVWSTWLWQKTRWPNCRPVPAPCGTSRRTCRTSNWTAGGAVAWLLITYSIITLQSLNTDSSAFHTSTPLPSVD